LRKWNFKHLDIVSILAFVAYRGSTSRGRMRFSGKALNRIRPILSKYFKNIKERSFHYKYPDHISMRLDVCNTEFLRQAIAKGWSFKKAGSDDGIPDYVFQDVNLFRHFLSIVMDCNAHLYFCDQKTTGTIILMMSAANDQRWNKLRSCLAGYGLPSGHICKMNNYYHLKWYGQDVYTLLDFIGWDLQRPRNVSIMKYLREKQDAVALGKHAFM
jgi:hypothetical protein